MFHPKFNRIFNLFILFAVLISLLAAPSAATSLASTPEALVGIPRVAQQTSTGLTTRVSVASDGTQGNDRSTRSSISVDGRYVAFSSDASNLVTDDTNETGDIFLYDRHIGDTMRVSISSDGTQGNGWSDFPSISSDGRYVTFMSYATNLVAQDTNNTSDIFVHDRQTRTTTRVSVAFNGDQSNGESSSPTISDDGRFIAFHSKATNLVVQNLSAEWNVYVYDMQTSNVALVSVSSYGLAGNDSSSHPKISGTGRFVSFGSVASNLVDNDTNGIDDVFVHDLQTGQTMRVSVNSEGDEATGFFGSFNSSISKDGRYVAFQSYATNLSQGDTFGLVDVFLHDRETGKTIRINVPNEAAQDGWGSSNPSISDDGRYIAFDSYPTVGGYGFSDIYIYDRYLNNVFQASVNSYGVKGNQSSYSPVISANGKHVAFVSGATNLVTNDTNDTYDVFVHSIFESPTFPDVPTDHWAWAFIERLANAGITSGFPDGTYRPAQAVTRGQMAVFLLKAMHYPGNYSPPDVDPTFSDTAEHWAEDWIEALKASGITGGFPDGTYRPEANVTRGQMAIFLLKALNGPGYEPPPAASTFDDTAEHWASNWIEALRASGLTGGYPDGTFRPDNPVTRAEMAVFIVNAFELP